MIFERKIVLEINLTHQEEGLQEIILQRLNILIKSLRGIESARIDLRSDESSRTERVIEHGQFNIIVPITKEWEDAFMTTCVDAIITNVEEIEFNTYVLAGQLNLSKATLYRRIKSMTNLSAKDLVKAIKMQIALQLLSTRKYTVSEVAWKCGYSSIRHFSRIFYESFRKHPSKVRLGRI